MSEWQPIETAPKDGDILVMGKIWRDQRTRGVEGVLVVSVSDGNFKLCNLQPYSVSIVTPTHWMPLPSPPSPTQTS